MEFSNLPLVLGRCVLIICSLKSLASATMTATCAVAVNSALASDIQDNVTGTVTLTQVSGQNTTIQISLTGFNTADNYTKHGFHIHELADTSNGCNSLGGHYNPQSVNHGGPSDTVRHVGDLGNIEENGQGIVSLTLTDNVVSLENTYSVIGRSIVVHEKEDDLGQGGDSGSLATGNAGRRLACCIIQSNSVSPVMWSMQTLFFTVFCSLFLWSRHQ